MKISGIFKGALPWITTALTSGPAGVATMALGHVGKALGVEAPKTADAALKALETATPEQLQALKAEDHAFSLRMKELGVQEVTELARIDLDDRKSARDREIKAGDSWTPRILAAVFVVGWFVIQWYLLRHIIPTEMREIIMRTLGTLDMVLGLIVGYYFGSSHGSDKKNDLIAKLSSE